nr:MAG TPA: hypothetical protein [Caudoviricetes sp.]
MSCSGATLSLLNRSGTIRTCDTRLISRRSNLLSYTPKTTSTCKSNLARRQFP